MGIQMREGTDQLSWDPRLSPIMINPEDEVLLENKNAVVYGAGGAIGAAVAGAFAREGARVFLAGRTRATLDKVASEISALGGTAEVAEVDALDEGKVEEHAAAIARKVGGLDISFNAISHGDVHGKPLLEMPFEDFARPISTAVRSKFLTSRAAARQMATRRSGIIMTITATTARQSIPEVGHGSHIRRRGKPLPSVGVRTRPTRDPRRLAANNRNPRGAS